MGPAALLLQAAGTAALCVGPALLHRHLSSQRSKQRQRDAWAEDEGEAAPLPFLGRARAAAPAWLGPSLVDLDSLDSKQPAGFYLPGDADAMEQLSDCYARVEGAVLPLHGQLLAAQAAVLREAFVVQAEGGAAAAVLGTDKSERAELSSAFSGCSLTETAVFLRFIYSPDHATPASLHAVAARKRGALLASVAGLAHRLDAAGLLAKIEVYLSAASSAAPIPDLIATVQLAEACHLSHLADTCLALLARRLAAAGPFWHEQVNPRQLAGCTSESLASLACKMAGRVAAGAFEPPAVHGLGPGIGGAAGGFTWVINRFSKQQGRVTSPWVKVGGVEWRLKVWPRGDDAAGGTHLSAYLECNHSQAAARNWHSVEAFYDFAFLDQSEEGLHYCVDCGKDTFTAQTQNWGKTRMVPLDELQRPDRSYLSKDRLAVRIAVRVVPQAALPPAVAFHANAGHANAGGGEETEGEEDEDEEEEEEEED